MKKIVKGNDFRMLIPVRKRVNGEDVKFSLPACTDISVSLINSYRRIPLTFEVDTEDDSVLIAKVTADALSLGKYALEVKGKIFGAAWRSNEYEQICLVDNNASGDTEFGETIEGEDSVEMNTAYIILPPQEDLRQLVEKTEQLVGNVQQLESNLNANEQVREKAESRRTDAENERMSAEETRSTSEDTRQTSEQIRVDEEIQRITAEEVRAMAETTRTDAEKSRAEAESNRAKSEEQRTNNEVSRNSEEEKRVSAENVRSESESTRRILEKARQDTEQMRTYNEDRRIAAEEQRAQAELLRASAEVSRASAEQGRINAEQTRENVMASLKSEVLTATQQATEATALTNNAIANANTATEGAEKVNATIEGTSIVVTDREGVKQSLDVINTDEKVSITIDSSVSGISVSGIKLNVYLNNGKTPQTYTTNSEGKVSFVVARGNYYEIVFPEYGNAKPISPIGYTALLAARNISVIYEGYKEEDVENIVVAINKYTDDIVTPWADAPVLLTLEGRTTTLITDTEGKVCTSVPLGKTYTINVEDADGYHVNLGRNKRTYTANMSERRLEYRMYPYELGVLIIDTNGDNYYLDEWKEAKKDSSEAVAIKIATIELYKARAAYMLRISDLINTQNIPSKQWCTSNVLFSTIAENGNNVNDALYYKGQESSFLIMQEAIEHALLVPAFDYANSETLTVGEQTENGFLMSAGQMLLFIANLNNIKQILATLYGDDTATTFYDFASKKYKWTSTQSGATTAYSCTLSLSTNYKSGSYDVLPVFAC